MCRLYGLKATEPTKVECSLVHAQNALMAQSREDTAGLTHGHGWGVATYADGMPSVERQTWAAYHGEHFRKTAARVYSRVVIAHVRHATVGPPGLENTHPFSHGRWVFAHNGTVSHFDRMREPMLEAMDFLNRSEIRGSTDSEHIFRYLLSLWERDPARPLLDILRLGLEQIVAWSREIDPDAPISLNVLWSDGEHLAGSRLGRTLWFLERDGLVTCDVCGTSHVHHDAHRDYRAVEIASEPITHERWLRVPNGVAFTVDPDMFLHFAPLEITASAVTATSDA